MAPPLTPAEDGGSGGGDSHGPAADTGVSDWLETRDHRAFLRGYADGTFRPDRLMTRAQTAQMFYNLLLDRTPLDFGTFPDVPEDAWCYQAVGALAGLGILRGTSDGTFAPDRPVTRAEFAVIAMRFARDPGEGGSGFADVAETDWFAPQVAGAAAYGWINGYADGTFRPDRPVTRAQAAAIVCRMLGRTPDEAFIAAGPERLRTFTDLPADHWAYGQIAEAVNPHRYARSGDGERWLAITG